MCSKHNMQCHTGRDEPIHTGLRYGKAAARPVLHNGDFVTVIAWGSRLLAIKHPSALDPNICLNKRTDYKHNMLVRAAADAEAANSQKRHVGLSGIRRNAPDSGG